MKHVLSVLVENKSGVLSRVVALIARRGFNIDSLSVGPTEDPTRSRITIIVDAEKVAYDQITKQLNKLVCVYKIQDLTNDAYIERELVLFKVNAPAERRSEVIEIANLFRASVVDVGASSLTIEATGSENKLKGMEELLESYGIKEITRTGKIAISRNSKEAQSELDMGQIHVRFSRWVARPKGFAYSVLGGNCPTSALHRCPPAEAAHPSVGRLYKVNTPYKSLLRSVGPSARPA